MIKFNDLQKWVSIQHIRMKNSYIITFHKGELRKQTN